MTRSPLEKGEWARLQYRNTIEFNGFIFVSRSHRTRLTIHLDPQSTIVRVITIVNICDVNMTSQWSYDCRVKRKHSRSRLGVLLCFAFSLSLAFVRSFCRFINRSWNQSIDQCEICDRSLVTCVRNFLGVRPVILTIDQPILKSIDRL